MAGAPGAVTRIVPTTRPGTVAAEDQPLTDDLAVVSQPSAEDEAPPKPAGEDEGPERNPRRGARPRRRGRRDEEPVVRPRGDAEAAEAPDEVGADEAPADEADASGEEVDNLSDWSVPSWQDLVDSLHRPDR